MAIIYLLLAALSGIGLTSKLPLPKISTLLVGPAVGIITTTTITLITSWIFGFAPLTVWLTLVLIMLLMYLTHTRCVKLSHAWCDMAYIQSHWPLIFIYLTIGVYATYIFLTQVLAPAGTNLLTGGGGLYGDTALHSAYTTSLVEQGLPPQNPLFAGHPLIYPFLVNFFSAILIKLGLNLRLSFVLPQLIYLIAFITLFYLTAKTFTHNLGTFLSMLIFFLGWGWGFISYFTQVFQTGNWTITQEFTNNMRDFHLHNALTGLIFPERSFLPGLVIGLLITYLIFQQWNQTTVKQSTHYPPIIQNFRQFIITNSKFITVGIFLGILPLWHTHTFIFFGVSSGLWILLTHPALPVKQANLAAVSAAFSSFKNVQGQKSQRIALVWQRKLGKVVTEFITFYLTAFLASLPTLIFFATNLDHERFLHLSWGWINTADNQLLFWWKNTGLLIPLAIWGLLKMGKQNTTRHIGRRRLHAAGVAGIISNIWWFFLPPIIMFFIANLVIFQPWEWDNIKLLSWVFLFLVIPAGYALEKLFSKNIFIKIIAFIIFITLIASGILSLSKQTQSKFIIYDKQDQDLAAWIKTNTLPSEVFLIDPWPNHPVPGLSGRSVYLGYPGHLWVHGIDYYKRENQVRDILAGNTADITRLDMPVNYIVTLSGSITNSGLTQVYSNSKYSVLKIF